MYYIAILCFQLSLLYCSADTYNQLECLSASINPDEYRGYLNVVYDGKECEPWVRHKQFYHNAWSEDEALHHKNYCRNPDGDAKGPWCPVGPSSFKYCNVPRCAEDVGCYDGNGGDYFGHQDRTGDGKPCQDWTSIKFTARPKPKYRYRMYMNQTKSSSLLEQDSRLKNFNLCRNPIATKSQPWCFVRQGSMVSYAMADCNVPKCSDPGTLGYILNNPNTTKCAETFLRQQGTITQREGEKEYVKTITYCVAPHRLVNRYQRREHYDAFTDFCLFIVGETRHCPAGFRFIRRIDPTAQTISHISGPAILRIHTEYLLESLICCSQPDYFKQTTTELMPQHIRVERSSNYKSSKNTYMQFKSIDRPRPLMSHNHLPAWYNNIIPNSNELLQKPLFTSILRCPAVRNTTRIFRDERITSELSIPKMITCEYHSLEMTETPKTASFEYSPFQVGLLNNDESCPNGFFDHTEDESYRATGATYRVCVPGNRGKLPTPSTEIGYCLVVVTVPLEPLNGMASDKHRFVERFKDASWAKKMNFSCPIGFRPNQLAFSDFLHFPMKLCCTGNPSAHFVRDETEMLQVPFGVSKSFAVIRNGNQCPVFHSDSKKWQNMEYTKLLKLQDNVELVGEDEPITTNQTFGFGICQYSSPDLTFGVRALAYHCDGLGDHTTMNQNGVTCAIALNSTDMFQPGRYCLISVSPNCPTGFERKNTRLPILNNFETLETYCCRTEESIGSINWPIELHAPFKLPAIHQPCQVIKEYMVDYEFGNCVYYPQKDNPMALMVWPRIAIETSNASIGLNKSEPAHCEIPNMINRHPPRSQVGRLVGLLNLDLLVQDRWLTYRRPRWASKNTANNPVCFTEAPWSLLPRIAENGKTYCIFAFGSCPLELFETHGASTYMNTILCCSRQPMHPNATLNIPPSTPYTRLRTLVTLGHALPQELDDLNNHQTSTILFTGTESSEGCPQFSNMQLDRRVLDVWKLPTEPTSSMFLPKLFNITHMDEDTFKKTTGIWRYEGLVYIIFCEYRADPNKDFELFTWPIGNYAIPKPVTACPNESRIARSVHMQNEQGVHYSQPIHLDGFYLRGFKYVSLKYCTFTVEPTKQTEASWLDPFLPPGHYCVLRVRGICPEGFTEGRLSIVEGSKKRSKSAPFDLDDLGVNSDFGPDIDRTNLHTEPDQYTVSKLNYHFCCRADSSSVDNSVEGFPSETGPFYLYRVGDKCQEIKNMRVTPEHICMDAPSVVEPTWWKAEQNKTWSAYRTEGLTPIQIPNHLNCDVQINLCYYEKDAKHDEQIPVSGTGSWPTGRYALPNVHRAEDDDNACPPGFKQSFLSLMEHRNNYFHMDIIPNTLENYFIELMGHDHSVLNVHYCERLYNETTSQDTPSPDKQVAMEWPRGDYCVFSTASDHQCPPGLHRHSRAVEELCCRTDEPDNQNPVNLPFGSDFFLISQNNCLPIENTKVERYWIHLNAESVVEKSENSVWDILCHYMPSAWFKTKPTWPVGAYLLPIGRRSGLRTTSLVTVHYEDIFKREHLVDALYDERSKTNSYECPDTFERAVFTFISQHGDIQELTEGKDGEKPSELKTIGLVAMEFCIKTKQTNSSTEWPRGDYCVFTMNTACPVEMAATEELVLKIPDYLLKSVDFLNKYGKPIRNHHWQEEAKNHVVYFMQCCRTDNQLTLNLPPSKDGYYLASLSSRCSHIPGTLLDKERMTTYFRTPSNFSETDWGVGLLRNFVGDATWFFHQAETLHLCYYHPGKNSDLQLIMGPPGSQMATNLTEKDLDDVAKLCGCAENARCLLHRKAECTCKLGYFGDGRHICREITPLHNKCANLCDQNAICTDSLTNRDKLFTHHFCMCKVGYVGDGFTCKPSCQVHPCHPFSQCVINSVDGSLKCKCIPGSIASNDKCYLDVYKSINMEKELPQFLLYHDHCLSEQTRSALKWLEPKRYFYVFAPNAIIKSCEEVASHLVVLSEALSANQLKAADADHPMKLVTENNTVIEIYPQNETWMIDGNLASTESYQFTNGQIFVLSAQLKLTPYVDNRLRKGLIVFGVLFLLLSLIGLVLYIVLIRRGKCNRPRLPRHFQIRPVPFRRAFWSSREESILVEDVSDTDE